MGNSGLQISFKFARNVHEMVAAAEASDVAQRKSDAEAARARAAAHPAPAAHDFEDDVLTFDVPG